MTTAGVTLQSAPLISAMMPARNAAATIGAAIRSVIWQTFQDWELVVVDDGSTDGTYDVAVSAAGGDPRIRIQRFPFAGRGTARNRCMEFCRAPYVAICDADDLSVPNRFQSQLAVLIDRNADVVSCSRTAAILGRRVPEYALVSARSPDDIAHAFASGRMPIQFASVLMRREVITDRGGFDSELHRNQDFGLLMRSTEALRFHIIDDILILYRTPAFSAPYRLLAENNFYRLLARIRAAGTPITAQQLRSSPRGAIQRWLLAPLQYLKHTFDRRILGRGIQKLTSQESQQLSDIFERSHA